MKTTHENLAAALTVLHTVQKEGIVRSKDLKRSERELLMKTGFLEEIIKGWYFETRPNASTDIPPFWWTPQLYY